MAEAIRFEAGVPAPLLPSVNAAACFVVGVRASDGAAAGPRRDRERCRSSGRIAGRDERRTMGESLASLF